MRRPLNLRILSRLRALADYRILDSPEESMFNNLALLASEICETPVAQISLIDDRRQWLKAHIGFGEIELPLHESFCRHAMQSSALFVVRDASDDPRFAANRLVVDEPHVRFYAGAPLIAPGDIPLGAICAIDFRPRDLSQAQSNALQSLARQTVALLELRRLERLSKRRAAPKILVGRCRRSRDLIGAVAEIAAVALEAETMLSEVLNVVCNAIGARIGHVWIPDSHLHGSAAPLHVRHVHDDALAITLEQPGVDDPSSLWASLLRDVPMCITEIPSDYSQVAAVVVPMPGRGLPGLLGLYHPEPITLGPDLRAALKQVGALVGQAMQRLHSQTVLQLSETYFRHLVEDALDLITVLDREGVIQFESHSIAEQLGWAPDDILGHNAFEFVHPDDCAAVLAAFAESLRTEGPTPILCFRFRHQNGSYRSLEGRGNNLLGDPSVRGIVFSSRNITEKKRLEDQFGQLAGGIAHDFNNLLSVIVGYSSKAGAHPQADATLKQAVEQIQRASERAAGLTGQLLAFTGRQVLQPRTLCLDELLAENESGWRLLLGSRVRLTIKAGVDGACVHADVAQIDMVLRHLVLNARDALARGGGEVVIESRTVGVDEVSKAHVPSLAPGDYCLIEVRDNGCGMSPEVCGRVFEPYFTTKPLGKGSGMGLATCQGILKQSGGGIALQSVLERGTSASLYLPLALREPADAGDRPAPLPRRARSAPTVLFAEDEEALRDFGVSILEELGCRVLVGENGHAALDLLDAEPDLRIDLLLTDIVMPEMDGKQLADVVRSRFPTVAILFCSGYAHDPTFYVGLPAGASFLPKPYSAAMLAENVGRALPAFLL